VSTGTASAQNFYTQEVAPSCWVIGFRSDAVVSPVSGWVRRWYRYHPLPAELGMRLAPHPAQAARLKFKVSERTPIDRAPGLPKWVSNFSPGRALVSSSLRLATRPRQHPFRLGKALSGGLCLPRAFRLPAFASWPSCPARASAQPCGKPTAESRPYRGFHVPHRQAASGELASLRRERGTVSAEPLIPADLCSSKDVSATCVPFCITTLPPRLHLRSTRSQLFLA
jgi:hypothetical protein